jgi:hypothetical protein
MFKASIDAEHELQGSCCVTGLESSWAMVDKMWLMVQVWSGLFLYVIASAVESW